MHAQHAMHSNSLAAFAQEQARLSTRSKQVLDAITTLGPMTDREVCDILDYREINNVQPRITELLQSGRLVELKKVKSYTGKMVRLVGLPNFSDVAVPIA